MNPPSPVANAALRLKEATKLGFDEAWVPETGAPKGEALRAVHHRHLKGLVDKVLGR